MERNIECLYISILDEEREGIEYTTEDTEMFKDHTLIHHRLALFLENHLNFIKQKYILIFPRTQFQIVILLRLL
jgi:hypothetical protein